MPLLRDETEFGSAAQAMIHRQLVARGIADGRVLDAMRTVPRHAFVSPFLQRRAYEDAALPTRNDQTISQPYIVALMSQLLDAESASGSGAGGAGRGGGGVRALEIGTGSGYQTMILSLLVGPAGRVVSVERDAQLADDARAMLDDFAIANVVIHVADGSLGWPDDAPYDRILVTAGAPAEPPRALLDQLADGGRLVIPLGDADVQHLYTIDRRGDELVTQRSIACRFVPLVGEQGW